METDGKKYDVIYADPPWNYVTWSIKGNGRSAERHYRTMDIQRLTDMDIGQLCNKDCILLMWATFPCLTQALKLGEAWGFTYKTVAFTWIKVNRGNNGYFMGMGYYTRSNAEVVLLFTKGKPLARLRRDIRQLVAEPRLRHSQKPRSIRKLIVELFGDRPRLELFARENDDRELFRGWDVYGDEISGSITIHSKE
ncbi:MT-A70 family methyltransferase [uncultured Pedobacter sp.]|uniref:MT-A70 family methyltransferase n=1 Tax=uncultured Pedobacter sp. TaxID=246139 RepID=UPI002624E2A1|nr:MT-A70 family methyltransferase [uncultured Pedobacter sp.]